MPAVAVTDAITLDRILYRDYNMIEAVITGSGCYIPPRKVPNSHFLQHRFFDADHATIGKPNAEVVAKLKEITCIEERRYVPDGLLTSDMAFAAAELALSDTDRENLDYILIGQNIGDVKADNARCDMVPTLAARVKHQLGIKNPYTVAFDIPFGCPGWLQCVIMADYLIKSGDARKILVIGAETLSRVSDPHDVDGMIYADGAGAVLLEAAPAGVQRVGILSHVTRSDTHRHYNLLRLGTSYNPDYPDDTLFIKMDGHDIYKYALKTVPGVVARSLDKAGLGLQDVTKVLIHQANQKMDEAILKRLFKRYKIDTIPKHIMPMTISWLGNSSVATLPTLYDLLVRGKLANHHLKPGNVLVFASVGAGMNINSLVYRVP